MFRTDRDNKILETLCIKVRLLNITQVASTWWSGTPNGRLLAKRRLCKLVQEGFLEKHSLLARPLLELITPIAVWKCGEKSPDFEAVSYALKKRWTKAPEVMVIYISSRKTRNEFGGYIGGKLKHREQASHDLHVSSIYLNLLKSHPQTASAWVGSN